MLPESDFRIAPNWPWLKNDDGVTIFWHDVIADLFDIVLFLL